MGVFEIIIGIATILGAIASICSALSLHSIRSQINYSLNSNITDQKSIGINNKNTNKITYAGNPPQNR